MGCCSTPSFVGTLFSAGIAIFRVRICRVNIADKLYFICAAVQR